MCLCVSARTRACDVAVSMGVSCRLLWRTQGAAEEAEVVGKAAAAEVVAKVAVVGRAAVGRVVATAAANEDQKAHLFPPRRYGVSCVCVCV